MAARRLGLWLIGAQGNVATTAMVGLFALQKRLVGPVGLVTELPPFHGVDLRPWESWVVGGHDIRPTSLMATAEHLVEERVVPSRLLQACQEELQAVQTRLRPGILYNCGEAICGLHGGRNALSEASGELPDRKVLPRALVTQLQEDLRTFQQTQQLEQVIVVYLASTEPPVAQALPTSWGELAPLLEQRGEPLLRASSLYAIAALELGMPFVNFTPSVGASLPALEELACRRGTCHAGQDGKTGETLLKTVLAPMFAHRHLEVMSWVGHNIFGNLDSRVLDAPANRQSKLRTKDDVLASALGYAAQSHVSIERIESLGDWKTAWDHVHFRGFLGTPMTLQFTWQGADSALAAPLVLDLARLVERSARQGEVGALPYLASFFKRPLGSEQQAFEEQYRELLSWLSRMRDTVTG